MAICEQNAFWMCCWNECRHFVWLKVLVVHVYEDCIALVLSYSKEDHVIDAFLYEDRRYG